jgi:NifU-like protein involved in Fe-S cluster formation
MVNSPQAETGPDQVQELLREHARRAAGRVPALSLEGARMNPSCGDRVVVNCTLDESGLVLEWNGEGCSLMQAGASLLVTTVSGLQKEAARACLLQAIRLASLAGVQEDVHASTAYSQVMAVMRLMQAKPNRRECLLLAWRAVLDWLERSDMVP